MFSLKIKKMIKEYGIKQEAIAETMEISRVTFWARMKDNSFKEREIKKAVAKYGSFLD